MAIYQLGGHGARTAYTLIDRRPVRPLVSGQRRKTLLVRTVHGYDSFGVREPLVLALHSLLAGDLAIAR